MTYALTWLPTVLHDAGLQVVDVPGWQTRGHGDIGAVKGVLCHHTAGCLHPKVENVLHLLINGRPDLAGPLCHLMLDENGVYYMIAAGKAWHAGDGEWHGVTSGNSSFIGIEAENTGLANDPWDAPQMDSYVRGCAAILAHIGAPVYMAAGHKEYALPRGRKIDPSFDMDDFRGRITTLWHGGGT